MISTLSHYMAMKLPLFDNLSAYAWAILVAMSTPVIFLTVSGRLPMMSSTSLVTLLAPMGPSPVETMVILFVSEIGPATSAATLGNTFSIMSTNAASLYSFQASAFLAICSASALAFTSIA